MSTRKRPPGLGSAATATPLHRMRRPGSIRKGKTPSGGAAIQISTTTSSPESLSIRLAPPPAARGTLGTRGWVLCGGPQPPEAVGPEPLEEGAQLAEPLLSQTVEAPRSLAPDGDQPGLLQDAEVLRHGGGRLAEVRGDLAGGELVGGREDLEDPPAVRLGDGLECGFHGPSLSESLTKRKEQTGGRMPRPDQRCGAGGAGPQCRSAAPILIRRQTRA